MLQTENLLTEEEFEWISDMVHKHCGINLHQGKKELVRARLAKRLRVGGFSCVRDYLDHVLADKSGREFTILIDSLSTNLTSFFRENSHFEFLSRTFLPALLARKRRDGRGAIRAWSAACSSGEEPYSLAITLLEAVQGQGAWDIKILATDISTRVLQMAQQGVYDKKRVESVPAQWKARYLHNVRTAEGMACEVSPALREIVRLRHLNLMENWPFTGPFDFIFCRNVMIYFDKPTQQKLVNRFYDHLDSGGMLFTGHSESLTGITHRFRYVQPTIYAKP